MTEPDWSRGLPPVAADRIARAHGSRVAGSLFSAPAAAAARIAGLEPVGEAMGLTVQHIPAAWYGCGGWTRPYRNPYGGMYGTTSVLLSGEPGGGLGSQGWAPRVRALYQGWNTALNRMVAEAEGLRAHGVVGVRLDRVQIDSGGHEFRVLGTAVRYTGLAADPEPGGWQVFLTDLTAEDVAKLMLNGWLPRGIAIGISIGVRHDDWYTRSQAGSWSNTELDGLSRLMNLTRHDAREQLHHRALRFGAQQVVISSMSTDLEETRCQRGGQDNHDHVATAQFIGTALGRDPAAAARVAGPASLTVMPLTNSADRRRNR